MFAILFHVLSMLLPSRLLKLPKSRENMEISIKSPKMIKMVADTGTSSIPVAKSQGADGSAADHGSLSSTASSSSNILSTSETEKKREMPRTRTPESSVGNEDSPSGEKILSSSGLWTEQSEKARGEDAASPSHHADLHIRLSLGHLSTLWLCPARIYARRY